MTDAGGAGSCGWRHAVSGLIAMPYWGSVTAAPDSRYVGSLPGGSSLLHRARRALFLSWNENMGQGIHDLGTHEPDFRVRWTRQYGFDMVVLLCRGRDDRAEHMTKALLRRPQTAWQIRGPEDRWSRLLTPIMC